MHILVLEIGANGGSSYHTGISLRNKLLNITNKLEELLVYGISKEKLEEILTRLEIPFSKNSKTSWITDEFQIELISDTYRLYYQSDFTINCINVNALTADVIDPYSGLNDLRKHIVRIDKEVLINNPNKLIEACRLTSELDFSLDTETWFNIYDNSRLIKLVEMSKIKEELEIIFKQDAPSTAIKYMQETRLLEYILPELAGCENIMQSKRDGVKNVFEHTMYSIDAVKKDIDLRLTMLFHDIAKPQTMECSEDGIIHFFKHEVIGAKIAKKYLKVWGFSKETVQKVTHLISHHMFDADPKLTDRGVRRLVRKVGEDYIYDLLKVREADRRGTPKTISMKKIKLLKKRVDKAIDDIRIVDGSSNSNSDDGNRNNSPSKKTIGNTQRTARPRKRKK